MEKKMSDWLKSNLWWACLALLLTDAGLAHHFSKKAAGPWWDRAVVDFIHFFGWALALEALLAVGLWLCLIFANWLMQDDRKIQPMQRDPHGFWANRQSSWQPVTKRFD